MATSALPARTTGPRRWFALAIGTRRGTTATDAALAAVRFVLAWIFVYYGATKLFGWWNGPGIHRSATFFAETAHLRPGTFFAVLAGLVELLGALALAAGVLSRLAGAALCVEMVVAMVTVTARHGINSEQVPPGYELNLTLAVLALVIALLGAGRFSVDAIVERRLAIDDH